MINGVKDSKKEGDKKYSERGNSIHESLEDKKEFDG